MLDNIQGLRLASCIKFPFEAMYGLHLIVILTNYIQSSTSGPSAGPESKENKTKFIFFETTCSPDTHSEHGS